jgi:indolepyruvate decarboxylase
LCGDGAFQMTGPEISHAPMFKANPIVLLINNGGWGIFRPVAERRDLLTIPPWPYAKLAQDWGGAGFVVEKWSQLRPALEAAHAGKTFAIIDVKVGVDDLSPMSVKYIKSAAKRSRTPHQSNSGRAG